jgi:serine/threonine-protein kinase
VFLCTSSAVKILDFGIARLQSVAQAQLPTGQTGRDVTLGTPGYMPPEQARGHWDKVDAQSDLWSFGATLFAILGGRLVHEAPTVNEQLLAAMTQPAPPLSSVAPEVPAEVAALVDRALAFEKSERWPDADAMQSEVARVYELASGRSISRAPPVSVATKPRSVVPDAPTVAASEHGVARTTARSTRRRWEILLVGGAGVALAAIALLLLVRGGAPSEAPRPIDPPSSPAAKALPEPRPSPTVSESAKDAKSAESLATEPVGGNAPDAGSQVARRGTGASKPPSLSASAKPAPSDKQAVPSAAPEPDIFVRRK